LLTPTSCISASFFKKQVEHERQIAAMAQEELKLVKKKGEAAQIAYEQEEEFITNRLLGRLEDLKGERVALAKQVEAEEDFLVNTLQRRLAKLHKEKAAVEAKLQGEQDGAAALQRRLNQLSEEKKRLVTERTLLENTLEAEQEHISLKLTKQIEKLAAEKANLAREKADLARQVGDLSDAVTRTRQEKVALENTLEAEEEAATNRLQRQLEQVTNAYRALEARLEAHGVHADGSGIDPTIEWVYSGRSPSRAASDRIITNARRERSLSVSSSSSMRDAASLPSGRPSFDAHLHSRDSLGGSGSLLNPSYSSGPATGHQSAASSPDHRRRLAALNSQAAAAALIGALQSQTLSQ
jgi:coiled-coil domain-containing protein 6